MPHIDEGPATPGLEWRKRADGSRVPYWTARRDLVRQGYTPKTVNLSIYADNRNALAARCQILQAEMLQWSSGQEHKQAFDGSIKSLMAIWQTHEDSPYHEKRQTTREFYDANAKILVNTVGERQVIACSGIDVRRWFKNWSAPAEKGGTERLRRAKACVQTLSVALGFGQAMRLHGCKDLKDAIEGIQWPGGGVRDKAMTYAQAKAFVEHALSEGEIHIALAQAIMFECSLRQKDVIGEWQRDADTDAGGILFDCQRWDHGLVWNRHIDADLILRKATSKTSQDAIFDLKECELVMSVLQHVPREDRVGPVIILATQGRPYARRWFASRWRSLATAAGIPGDVWNMDSRAGGITEGRQAGASLEDLRHQATHSSVQMTARYDRKTPETTNKIAVLRREYRQKNAVGTSSSNA